MSQPVAYEEVAVLAETLSPQDKLRLIRQLTLTLERAYIAQLPEAPGWPPGFIEQTYGSLADNPIERLPQEQLQAGTVNMAELLGGLKAMGEGLTEEEFAEIERAMNEE